MRNLGMVYESLVPLDMKGSIKVNINGEDKLYYIISERVITSKGNGFLDSGYPVYIYDLTELQMVKIPTPEEIAATKSVEKAKEALKAAENALKAVKEKK